MIEYIKLFWEGAPEGEPSVILYEVDTENERLALRSIDIFADGRTRNIPALSDGAIEITPILTVEELNAHVWGEEFQPHSEEQRKRIEQLLGVKAYNCFGMSEMNGPGVDAAVIGQFFWIDRNGRIYGIE